jgi:IclR family pca regulon transcriptional regulator
MSIGLMPGSRLPAAVSSMGRVLLAALPRSDAQSLVERVDLAPRTRFSLTTPTEIMQRIDAARADGFAIVDQEIELGLRSIAVPLIDGRGRIVAALNTGMAATHESPEHMVELYLPKLLKIQTGLKRVL